MSLWVQFFLIMLFPLAGLTLVAVLVKRRPSSQRPLWNLLIVALSLNAFWASGLAAAFVGHEFSRTLVFWWQHLSLYALPLAAVATLFATQAFLRLPLTEQDLRRSLLWLAAGLLVTLLLDPAVLPWRIPTRIIAGRMIPHAGWWQIATVILWVIPATLTVRTVLWNYPRLAGPLHRNRVRYWALAVIVNALGDLLAISQWPMMAQAGAFIKVLAGVIAVLELTRYRLPDLRIILRRTTVILAVGAATFILFLAGMLGSQAIQLQAPNGEASYWLTAGLALLMTVLFFPIQRGVKRFIESITFKNVFDLDAVLRNYSDYVCQALELEQLAARMLETVDEALHIRHGALILTKQQTGEEWLLEPVYTHKRPPLSPLVCTVNGLLAQRLGDGVDTLAQYDLDMLPEYAVLGDEVRARLDDWDVELYVPIRGRGDVVGFMALGAKESGDPYVDGDIVLLRTLADQTAVALENARLFTDLRTLNQEISNLNRQLGHANLELRELDKLKSSFIGMITHELRSPLVPLDFSLQLIEKQGQQQFTSELQDELAQMRRSLNHVRQMIDDLISFASLVSKQKTMEMGWVSLDEVVGDASQFLETIAAARRVSVSINATPDLPSIYGDRERLEDAVRHLMHNAIKFNRPGGSVEVRYAIEEETALIEVADSGRGIPADRLADLGTPFMQLADPVKRGVEGVGLGLSLVTYVVQAHGGELDIESELDVGSTFTIRLPVGGPEEEILLNAAEI